MSDEWPVGPPHHFSGDGGEPCRACGAPMNRAIHDAVYWARQRQIALVTADEYRRYMAEKENAR